METLLPAVFML